MEVAEVFVDALGRVREVVHQVLEDADTDLLMFRPDPEANSIAWLVWHLTRIQDDHVMKAMGSDQVWTSGGWAERFALPLDLADTGYGHSSEQVASVRADAELLLGYHDAVYEKTTTHLRDLVPSDLEQIVDERWDPPVTLGVRLVSVVADDLQHAGQASYIRGLAEHS
ncbi:MAG: mycothiol transferase [Acidimicrobiales bacterium]